MTERNSTRQLALAVLGIVALLAASADAADLAETDVATLGTIPAQSAVALSADGRHIAYVLKKGEKFVVVTDGRESREADRVHGLVMTPDGKHTAYAAAREGGWVIVVDGRETERYAAVTAPVFSPDGKRFAFTMNSGGDRSSAVVDGTVRTQYSAVVDAAPVFSPDGRRIAYEARTSGLSKRPTVRDPNRTPPPNEPPPSWVTDDGKEIDIKSGTAPRDNFMVVDERKCERTNDVRFPAFSPDGRHVAYAALFGRLWFIVLDERKVGDFFEDVTPPVFSPDGKSLAFAGLSEKKWTVIGPSRLDATWDGVHSMRFSPDGKQLVFAALEGRAWRVVCNGKKGPAFDEIGWIGFSMDSNHLAYAARRGTPWFVVRDGVEGPPHEAVYVPSGAASQALDSLRYVVVDGASGRLVETRWDLASSWSAGMK